MSNKRILIISSALILAITISLVLFYQAKAQEKEIAEIQDQLQHIEQLNATFHYETDDYFYSEEFLKNIVSKATDNINTLEKLDEKTFDTSMASSYEEVMRNYELGIEAVETGKFHFQASLRPLLSAIVDAERIIRKNKFNEKAISWKDIVNANEKRITQIKNEQQELYIQLTKLPSNIISSNRLGFESMLFNQMKGVESVEQLLKNKNYQTSEKQIIYSSTLSFYEQLLSFLRQYELSENKEASDSDIPLKKMVSTKINEMEKKLSRIESGAQQNKITIRCHYSYSEGLMEKAIESYDQNFYNFAFYNILRADLSYLLLENYCSNSEGISIDNYIKMTAEMQLVFTNTVDLLEETKNSAWYKEQIYRISESIHNDNNDIVNTNVKKVYADSNIDINDALQFYHVIPHYSDLLVLQYLLENKY